VGVFNRSLPELAIQVAPLVTEVAPSWKANSPRVRWAKKAGSCCRRMIVATADLLRKRSREVPRPWRGRRSLGWDALWAAYRRRAAADAVRLPPSGAER
jgi:hypothetical protein